MKLIRARITNFRSVEDSGEFNIDEITCLVGKNEAGKTAILQALAGLNPHGGGTHIFDRTRDYPRRYLTKYDERHPDGPARVITTQWELEPSDVAAIEAILGDEVIKSTTVRLSKSYDSTIPTVQISLDKNRVLQNLFEYAELTDAQRQLFDSCNTTADVHKLLVERGELEEELAELKKEIEHLQKNSELTTAADVVRQRLPKFLYFSNYDRMNGDISLNRLKEDQANNKVDTGDNLFLDFLKLAGTTLDDLEDSKKFEELKAKCEAASISITDQIKEYWSQNKALRILIEFSTGTPEDPAPFNSGTVVRARVYNAIHQMSLPFSERSAGFIWFFSFLVKFSQIKKDESDLVLLLDEPGLALHGKAQKDLLRYFTEKLQPDHQLIYSTHSPFMLPDKSFSSVRTVEDVTIEKGFMDFESHGTKVSNDALSHDPDTIFPLMNHLGYDIAQSLFIGQNTLLIEGTSDVLYIQAASLELQKRGQTGLDPKWVLCPVGGVDKAQSFASLFSGNKLHLSALLDYAKGQKQKVERFRESGLIEEDNVLLVTDFCNKEEADIEDLFDPDFMLNFSIEPTSLSVANA